MGYLAGGIPLPFWEGWNLPNERDRMLLALVKIRFAKSNGLADKIYLAFERK